MSTTAIIGGMASPDLLNPVLWLDPADTTTLFNAVSGGSTPLVGGAVRRIEDKGSLSLNYNQALSAGAAPRRQLDSASGLSCLRFFGDNDRMDAPASDLLRNVSGATLYVVCRFNAAPSSRQEVFGVATDSATMVRHRISGDTGAQITTGGRRLDANSQVTVTGGTANHTVMQVVSVRIDYAGAALTLYHNGSQVATTSSFHTSGSTSNTAASNSRLGASSSTPDNAANLFIGNLGDVLVYHSLHDEDLMRLHVRWLMNKWKIA